LSIRPDKGSNRYLQANADAKEAAEPTAEVYDSKQAELESKVELGDKSEDNIKLDATIPLAAVSSNGLFQNNWSVR
jgi:hypothetical protein